jgi:glycosyltransferase involved in cell wall biosynthesis
MEVLGLCSYPIEAAATRYRFTQFVAPLAEKGINLTVCPFLSSEEFVAFYHSGKTFRKTLAMINPLANRFLKSLSAKKFDVLLVQREAMMFGPPVFEWLAKTVGKCPLVLDLDDATYVRYVSPTYGQLGSALKFFGKTDSLIDWSEAVICGNRFIAEYVEKKGAKAVVVPTVVDTDVFCPVKKDKNKTPVIGWIGTHSAFPLLEMLFPVLRDLARKYDFVLKIVGSGRDKIEIEGVKIENLDWKLERETEDFQSLDIGLYPIRVVENASADWLNGKSGFKAIQYLALGIPFVVSPIGVCAEIGIDGETHFAATSPEQWYESLRVLLESFEERREMGAKGRDYALKHFTVMQQTDRIAEVLHNVMMSLHRNS